VFCVSSGVVCESLLSCSSFVLNVLVQNGSFQFSVESEVSAAGGSKRKLDVMEGESGV
jgi:hypothetical protein